MVGTKGRKQGYEFMQIGRGGLDLQIGMIAEFTVSRDSGRRNVERGFAQRDRMAGAIVIDVDDTIDG